MDKITAGKILDGILNKNQIFENEPMSRHTTFKVGGNAAFLVVPNTKEEISDLKKSLCGIPHIVIGNGSNLLFSDDGYDGVVIKLGNNFSDISVNGETITAESGALLSKIANVALQNGLGGFEFASGIPGSVGGAVYMNAGAYGGEMKDVVLSTTCVGESGNILILDDNRFSYRHSIYSETDLLMLETTIKLYKCDREEIKSKMDELNNRRKEKQPLNFPSAGSTFKRPHGYFAGQLIEEAGLKGYSIGGAKVSEKHAGFVINYDHATANDILNLIDHIKSEVYMRFGVELEPEIKIIGKE